MDFFDSPLVWHLVRYHFTVKWGSVAHALQAICKLECIPVGCVPSATVVVLGGVCNGGFWPVGVFPGGVCLGGVSPEGKRCLPDPLLWAEWLTDRCKNITLRVIIVSSFSKLRKHDDSPYESNKLVVYLCFQIYFLIGHSKTSIRNCLSFLIFLQSNYDLMSHSLVNLFQDCCDNLTNALNHCVTASYH